MIKFQALMQVIHQSIQSATRLVEEQGVKHIERFFDISKKDGSAPKGDGLSVESDDGETVYRPKTFTMEFPSRTPDGVETVTAEVPLITLSPISTPRISEVKFVTELEVTSDEDGELFVSFPSPKKSFFGRSEAERSLSNTKIEITVKGSETPEGLQKLIEGYERALRAQIPG